MPHGYRDSGCPCKTRNRECPVQLRRHRNQLQCPLCARDPVGNQSLARESDTARTMCSALICADERAFHMDANRLRTIKGFMKQRTQSIQCAAQYLGRCGNCCRKKRGRSMAGESPADGIHRCKSRVHYVKAGASVNVWIDESGDDGQPQGVDMIGTIRRAHVREQSNGIDSSISNDDAAWRKFVRGAQDRAGIDNQNAITHARFPEAQEPCEGCRRLR